MPPSPEWDIRPYAKHAKPDASTTSSWRTGSAGLQALDRAVPNASATAPRWLSVHKFSAGLRTSMPSHHEDDVYQDCVQLLALLQPSGVMLARMESFITGDLRCKSFCPRVKVSHLPPAGRPGSCRSPGTLHFADPPRKGRRSGGCTAREGQVMNIQVVTLWYNESFLAPFFLNHYRYASGST